MTRRTLDVGVSCERLSVWLLGLLLFPAQPHRGRGLSGPPGPQGGRVASPPKPHSPGHSSLRPLLGPAWPPSVLVRIVRLSF